MDLIALMPHYGFARNPPSARSAFAETRFPVRWCLLLSRSSQMGLNPSCLIWPPLQDLFYLDPAIQERIPFSLPSLRRSAVFRPLSWLLLSFVSSSKMVVDVNSHSGVSLVSACKSIKIRRSRSASRDPWDPGLEPPLPAGQTGQTARKKGKSAVTGHGGTTRKTATARGQTRREPSEKPKA